MTVYHQMGHQSDNLLHEGHLHNYRGAILSPVNYNQEAIGSLINEFADQVNFELDSIRSFTILRPRE